MKFAPVGTLVMVKVDPPEIKKQTSAIILAEETEKKHALGQHIGTVVALGSECFSPPACNGTIRFEVGDKVLFKRYAGMDAADFKEEDGAVIRFMHDTDIVAKVID